MSDAEIECQNHANCGDYCETPREIEMVLCEDCLDSYDMRERERVELTTLRARVVELERASARLYETLSEWKPKSRKEVDAKNEAATLLTGVLSAKGGDV